MGIWSKWFKGSERPPATAQPAPEAGTRVPAPAAAVAPKPTGSAFPNAPVSGRDTLRGNLDVPNNSSQGTPRGYTTLTTAARSPRGASPTSRGGASPSDRGQQKRIPIDAGSAGTVAGTATTPRTLPNKTLAVAAFRDPSHRGAGTDRKYVVDGVSLEDPLPPRSGPDFAVQFRPMHDEPATAEATKTSHSDLRDTVDSDADTSIGKEIENAFASVLSQSGSELEGATGTIAAGSALPGALAAEAPPEDLQEMFREMVALHLRPVRDLMLELRWGIAPVSWIDHCRSALGTALSASEKVGNAELAKDLRHLDGVLGAAAKDGRAEVMEARKEALLLAYEPILAIAPAHLSLEDERGRREPILIRSVLLQAKDVEHVTLGRLFGAGLSTMQGLLSANAEDVTSTANVPAHLSSRIVHRVAEYKTNFGTATASPNPQKELGELRALVQVLKRTQEALETASLGWSPEAKAKKRQLQKERARHLLQVSVLLARIGETDQLTELEKAAVPARIEQLNEFVQRAMTALGGSAHQ